MLYQKYFINGNEVFKDTFFLEFKADFDKCIKNHIREIKKQFGSVADYELFLIGLAETKEGIVLCNKTYQAETRFMADKGL
jgi:hypothetical protein